MFQQTIQDVLSLSEAGPGAEGLLERMRERIGTCERFEAGELVARTAKGLERFVFAPGLGDAGAQGLDALGDEPTLRIDTVADQQQRGILVGPAFNSLLILRLEASSASAAAIVLGHTRAWSFAAAPLSRIRTIGGVALRLLLAGSNPGQPTGELAHHTAEVARLRAHIASLEAEIIHLRADRARKGSDKPR